MKTFKILAAGMLLTSMLIPGACSDDDEEVIFIPNIEANTWTDQGDPSGEHTFFFFDIENPGEPQSNFQGNENVEEGQDRFTGYYDEEYIEITYTDQVASDPSKEGVKYTGKIEGKPDTERIVFNTPGGQLVLARE